MTNTRDPSGLRVQCVATSGGVTRPAIARLLRSIHEYPIEAISVRAFANAQLTAFAMLDAIETGTTDLDVHVRGVTTRPMAPALWNLIESGDAEVQSFELTGHGIEGTVSVEDFDSSYAYRLQGDVHMPDLSLREWRSRWRAALKTMPRGIERAVHDEARMASFAGVVTSPALARQALVALARLSRWQSAEIHWRVRDSGVSALEVRHAETVVAGAEEDDERGLEYKIMALVKAASLPGLAALVASPQHGLLLELVLRGLVLGTPGSMTRTSGDLVVSGADVVWTPSARAFGATLTAVQGYLESILDRRLVVLDMSAAEFEKTRAAADAASYAMNLLHGDAPACAGCGGQLSGDGA